MTSELAAPSSEWIRFSVPGEPVGQPRVTPRAIPKRGGGFVSDGKGRPVLAKFVPKEHPVHVFKAGLRAAAELAADAAGVEGIAFPDGPIEVEILAVFARPKAMLWKSKPTPRVWKTGKPDEDNVRKAVLDALNALLWTDDSQVAVSRTVRVVASGAERPGTFVRVRALSGVEPPNVAFER